MNTKLVLLLLLSSLAAGCGYGTKASTPAQAGNIPAITQMTPNSAISGGSAFTLTIVGSNFAGTAVVNFNGTAQATTFVSATQVTAAISASEIANPATVPVTVTNPAVAGGLYGGGTLSETSATSNFVVN